MWSQRELKMLSEMVGAVNCFSLDRDDEIQIVREDGSAQGVLKTWAAPFIAFLDSGNLEQLAKAWPVLLKEASNGYSFEQALLSLPSELAVEIRATIERWNKMCQESPDYFRRSLYRVLNNIYSLDAALLRSYCNESLDADPKAQLLQQLSRFRTAVGLLGPFYHIEAIVANESSRWSPLTGVANTDLDGGEMDALAFLLPAIFATKKNGHDPKDLYLLCKARVEEITKEVNSLSLLLWRIAKAFGISTVDIVFAAELLNRIPVRVGGKKEDFDLESAVAQANEILSRAKSNGSLVSVAKDVNAEIRFNNWLLVSEWDLYEAKYDSICGPAREIKRILEENPGFWCEEFRASFSEKIAQQLDGLDAESAKGRLLYQLIVQDKLLTSDFYPLELVEFNPDLLEISPLLVLLSENTITQRLFGDKAANMGIVQSVRPLSSASTDGFVFTTIAVDKIFFTNPKVRSLLCEIAFELSLEKRLQLGQQIVALLEVGDLGSLQRQIESFISTNSFERVGLWVVRSSCFGEDDPVNPSAGIYRSILEVQVADLAKAVLETVCSWFSEAAITHRYLFSQSDLPLVAVLLQPYLEGQGGVVEVRANPGTIVVHAGNSASAITSGEEGAETRFEFGELNGEEMEARVASLAQSFYEIFGELDLEWVFVDRVVKILQLKTYRREVKTPKSVERWVEYDVTDRATFETLQSAEVTLGLILKGNVNLEAFQGELFGYIARLGPKIAAIAFEKPIPRACHFANICSAYGIALKVVDDI